MTNWIARGCGLALVLALAIAGLGGCKRNRVSKVSDRVGRWAQSVEISHLGGTALDEAGNSYVVGSYPGKMAFGGEVQGGWDVYLAKFDPSGKELWKKRLGDARDQMGMAIAPGKNGDVAVAGVFTGTLAFGGAAAELKVEATSTTFIASLDAHNGDGRWAKGFDMGVGGMFFDVTVDPADGSFVAVGSARRPIDLGGGLLRGGESGDVVIARFDHKGDHRGSQRFQGAGEQNGQRVAIDKLGNIFVAGSYGYAFTVGEQALPPPVDRMRAFLIKLDGQMKPQWAKGFASAQGWQQVGHVAPDGVGGVLLAGLSTGPIDLGAGQVRAGGNEDAFVVRYDAGGKHLWSKSLGAPGAGCEGKSVAFEDDGRGKGEGVVWLVGSLKGQMTIADRTHVSEAGSKDALIVKLDGKTGEPTWSARVGDKSTQSAEKISLGTAKSGLSVAGVFMGQMTLGPAGSTLKGTDDGYHAFVVTLPL